MADKRATTPLFDLLQQGRPRGAEARPPEARPSQTEARPSPSHRPAPDRAGADARAGGLGEAPIRISGGVVQMPLVYAGVLLAVALTAVLVAWTLGYQRGDRQARREAQLRESALSPGSLVVEPGTGGTAPQRTGGQPGEQAAGGTANNTQPARPVPAVGQGTFLTASGQTDADPRLANHNYLILGAFLRADQIESAIAFLQERGIECFGVIDPGTRRRNDGPLYELWAGLGIPSGQADSDAARRYRQQVLAAGTAWKQAGGAKQFDDAYWKIYQP